MLHCFARLSPVFHLLKGRPIVLIADELEDWTEIQLLAAAAHCSVMLSYGDADQALRPVSRLVPSSETTASDYLLEPMRGQACRCMRLSS